MAGRNLGVCVLACEFESGVTSNQFWGSGEVTEQKGVRWLLQSAFPIFAIGRAWTVLTGLPMTPNPVRRLASPHWYSYCIGDSKGHRCHVSELPTFSLSSGRSSGLRTICKKLGVLTIGHPVHEVVRTVGFFEHRYSASVHIIQGSES